MIRSLSNAPMGSLSLAGVVVAVLLAGCGQGDASDVPVEAVRNAIADSIHARGDTISLVDPRTGEDVWLRYDHVHEAVDPTPGGRYVACVDFQGPGGTVYDVDYYVDETDGSLGIEDVILHKADGENVISDADRDRLDSLP